jgi:hypothetical protein
VGVDVFHAPSSYDPVKKQRTRPASCAALVMEAIEEGKGAQNRVKIYSKTFRRHPGQELQLGDALKATLTEGLRELDVKPKSAIVWRDGIAETAEEYAYEEINGIREGLKEHVTVGRSGKKGGEHVALAYILCQKRIQTKLLTIDGKYAAPPGRSLIA